MSINNAFEANIKGELGSFVGLLHEKGFLHHDRFRDLLVGIQDMVSQLSNAKQGLGGDQAFLKGLYHIIGYVNLSFIAHFNPNDGFKISNFPFDYSAYLDRLNVSMNAAIEMDPTIFMSFEDEFGKFSEFDPIT